MGNSPNCLIPAFGYTGLATTNPLNALYRHLMLLIAVTTVTRAELGKAAVFGNEKQLISNSALGEFGYSLELVRRHYSSPQMPGESNYFIDLWADQNLKTLASECKLTNNHALF